MTKLRWFILILGPLPIVGSSWAVSAWFKAEPIALAARNDAIVDSADERPARRVRTVPVAAGMQRACEETSRQLPQPTGDLNVVVRPPFVLAGDLPRAELETYYERSIAPAVRAMQARYFRTRPDRPITVLLFRGEESYNRYSAVVFGDSNVSIYGYYKPSARTLLVNTATGTGTLLHELTHALMAFEMPDAPDWFNEGLASLHEQCQFRSDARGPWIEGLVNWRLAGLQNVIRQQRLRPLADLMEQDDFRGARIGTNYAQARYFCLYLQRQGKLEAFFRRLVEHRETDPCGTAAAALVLGEQAWSTVDADFQQFVLQLSEQHAAPLYSRGVRAPLGPRGLHSASLAKV